MVITKQPHIGGEGQRFLHLYNIVLTTNNLPVPEHNDSYVLPIQHALPLLWLSLRAVDSEHSWRVSLAIQLRIKINIEQYTNPPTALGFWIALEKCTPENGALSFLPGSHLTTPLTKRFVRLPCGGTGFEHLLPPEDEIKFAEQPKEKYVLEECAPGMALLYHVQSFSELSFHQGTWS
jgi:hypothetical protein